MPPNFKNGSLKTEALSTTVFVSLWTLRASQLSTKNDARMTPAKAVSGKQDSI